MGLRVHGMGGLVGWEYGEGLEVIHFKTILSDPYQIFNFSKDMRFHAISGNVAV